MKKILALFLLLAGTAEAKFVLTEGSPSLGDKQARYMFEYMDKDKDGKLTLEEYKTKRITRDVRREQRQEKKRGTYKSLDEEFKIMDSDEDGFISLEDLRNYLNAKNNWEQK